MKRLPSSCRSAREIATVEGLGVAGLSPVVLLPSGHQLV